MANSSSHLPDETPTGNVNENPFASASPWRHQESSAFARYAAAHPHAHSPHGSPRREGAGAGSTGALVNFLNSSRIEPNGDGSASAHVPIVVPGDQSMAAAQKSRVPADGLEVVCGPLLNYRGMIDNRTWRGSVLIVVAHGGKIPPASPTLALRRVGAADPHSFVSMSSPDSTPGADGHVQAAGATTADAIVAQAEEPITVVQGSCLYSDPRCTFFQYDIVVEMEDAEVKWEYSVSGVRYSSDTKPRTNSFFTPATTESMRTMFFSCNGFSVGTDEDAWSHLALWNDVLRRHKEAPFHVIRTAAFIDVVVRIGGGDQIYNDGIRVDGPLRAWTDIGNPRKRGKYPFPDSLRRECDNYYLENYISWYNREPFASANGQIPQLNIWDDHDIIDGFGSYTDHFMRCDVFRGIGGTAHKYYLLFQHHLPPPPSTYTTDAVGTTIGGESRQGYDPKQVENAFVAPQRTDQEIGYIIGPKPGPYVAEHSVNLYARLGARLAFLGIDARTERTRHQINYPETYELLFSKLSAELRHAESTGQPITHLLILLGVPIAYPRLTWLENIFSSPFMGPMKFLNRRFGFGGSFFNKFDGSVDLLDDLDDHWTARTHKAERKYLISSLQNIAADHNLRITILSGDVHLAAVGRFYTDLKQGLDPLTDHRYMPNIISSAIVNKPPPAAVANLLAHRNKIHRMDRRTDETLLTFFDKQPGGKKKGGSSNLVTMPSRNYAMITENSPSNAATAASQNGTAVPSQDPNHAAGAPNGKTEHLRKKAGHFALHDGEEGAGTQHKAASAQHGKGHDGSLDVCIRVEIDRSDPQGKTQGYGMTIPVLRYAARPESSSASSSSQASRSQNQR
ncbi:hypothetical protein jhhlp_002381 [Lomentospora prolificans]|uniref:PhoD-like phosphatase domain-containing protein n=1 Tax=Lomentospora prolificans TaxID=41688 RepID=A0A2N3NDS3_9PEZI|nr:hypothetical protein jhhlp_002381 [Lomentospora prolificans]